MQITLVQSEIEQALTNYINDIMTVKDGMAISITLRATRGEEGTTAVIDILPLGQTPTPAPAPAPVATPAVRRAAQAPVKKAEAAPAPTPSPATTKVEPESTAGAEAAGPAGDAQGAGDSTGSDAGEPAFVAETTEGTLAQEVAESAGTDNGTEAAEATTEPPAATPEVATSKPKSLFANLRKPSNA